MPYPSAPTVLRTRYWLALGLRILALAMVVWVLYAAAAYVTSFLLLAREARSEGLGEFLETLLELVWQALRNALGYLLLALALWLAAPWIARRLAPMPRPGCGRCGYSLKGLKKREGRLVCPECGEETEGGD